MYLLQVLEPFYFDDGLALQLSAFVERSEEIPIDVELQADDDDFYGVRSSSLCENPHSLNLVKQLWLEK